MTKPQIAINGFGRVGRMSLRALLRQDQVTVVAINDLADAATLAHLFKYDSNYGLFSGEVTHLETHLVVAGKKIQVYAESDPAQLPWKALGIDTVLEATGRFTDQEGASRHLAAGARRVVISAPTQEHIPTVVLGVNDHILQNNNPIISNASCTTNCLAPMAKVLDETFGIDKGFINTIHAYTADQRLQDAPHKDLRRARAATQSIIPTATGAAKAVGLVLPRLRGKLDGMATRVPVANGSMTDFTVILKHHTTKLAINQAMLAAAQGALKGILSYTEDPIVSVDVIGNPHSCVFDALLTAVQGNLVKVVGWYDNEGGYAHRVADLIGRVSY
ncbi:MAG: type I glyceraldehyde-3-phosphate dehydrogenase [Amoebophilaceae bacterium]|jgi:glyceraldehyde 3-phosphate dehydrogenase|nr:type I glyceraldehyde-3-phosphate dehydrogenase [Amoebophilaceae bacterium]